MNKDKFRAAKFARPREIVKAPALAGVLFEESEPAQFVCVGLNANQLYMARQRRDENNPVRALVKTLQESGQLKNGIAEAMQNIFGDPDKATAAATAYSTELIVMGVIGEDGKPCLDYEDVTRLGEHFPVVFLELANTIQRLSGEGSTDMGESRGPSGRTIASEAPSPSATGTENSSTRLALTSSPGAVSPILN